ncbi:hypothetical protein NV379_02470 [Paenibacillus sp. N1-5-1-14]|uniref:hypothetical protein n=1 Tax=Paenibacillus radicibacter TaxID=2972488 RepID=UPI002159400C|nr:hypothetical protein [Paenibacillus radicibacter]MCR8641511.1 hypothetical protein [Paenibacillus radicibacter]
MIKNIFLKVIKSDVFNYFIIVLLMSGSLQIISHLKIESKFLFYINIIYFMSFAFMFFRGMRTPNSLNTRIAFILLLGQYLVYVINKASIRFNEELSSLGYSVYDTTEDTIEILILIVVLIFFCSLFRVLKQGTVVIKLIFYIIIALMTASFTFEIGFEGIPKCIDFQDFSKYQQCVKAFEPFETFKSNLLNILIIGISLFEALSNLLTLIFPEAKKKRET